MSDYYNFNLINIDELLEMYETSFIVCCSVNKHRNNQLRTDV